jgi:surfeit locus 1 family protein
VLLDRGFLASSRGGTSAPDTVLPPPAHVVGVLYDSRPGPRPFFRASSSDAISVQHRDGRERFEPVLVVEHENPAPPGVTPAPYPDPASNLEYVGTYAPTWFGLAVVALCFYAALLWRRYHPKR